MNVVVPSILNNIIGIVETAAVSPCRGCFSTTIRIDYQQRAQLFVNSLEARTDICNVISADTESPLLWNGT